MSEDVSPKKSKTTKIIIALVATIILIAVVGIGGYFGYLKLNGTGAEWGDTYLKYAKDISGSIDEISSLKEPDENTISYKKGIPHGVNNSIEAEFIDIDNDNTPEMVTTYTYNNDTPGTTVYHIEDKSVKYYSPVLGNEIVFLYNIEQKQYKYYVHQHIAQGSQHVYTPIEQVKGDNGVQENSISFQDDEIESKLDVAEGEIPVLSKFDQTFIQVEEKNKKIDIKANMSENEIKDEMKSSVKEYKDVEEIVTNEVKTSTENKVTEIENKKEEIKVAEEEKAKKEAEEKAKAEEEARKKAEEEAKQGLKAGNYTLKYGSYKCNEDGVAGGTFTINQDGTFTYKNNWANIRNEKYTDTASGKYSVYYSKGDDYDPKSSWIIKFNYSKYHSTYEPSNSYPHDFVAFDISGNNKFQYRQSAGVFTYQGN